MSLHSLRESRPLHALGVSTLFLLAAPVPVLWSWNASVAELFGAPVMDYRNALGFVVITVLVAFVLRRRPVRPETGAARS